MSCFPSINPHEVRGFPIKENTTLQQQLPSSAEQHQRRSCRKDQNPETFPLQHSPHSPRPNFVQGQGQVTKIMGQAPCKNVESTYPSTSLSCIKLYMTRWFPYIILLNIPIFCLLSPHLRRINPCPSRVETEFYQLNP